MRQEIAATANQGYTLLEILVVLVIISIVTSMAVLTVGGHSQRQLKTFTQGLAETITLAEEQALLQPATLALIFTDHDFGFYEYTQEGNQAAWKPIADNELGRQPLPPEITVKLKNKDQLTSPTKGSPALIIASNGNLSPFTLLLSSNDKTSAFEIIGHPDGTVISRAQPG